MGRRDQGQGGGLIGRLAGGGTFLYGMAQEVRAGNKARKAASQTISIQSTTSETSTASMQVFGDSPDMPPTYDRVMNEKSSSRDLSGRAISGGQESLQPWTQSSIPPKVDVPIRALPYPVILPQRRPSDKSRGFVRAYAPDLGTYKGIDQATFLRFLKDFHKNLQASPIFTVVNIAASGASFAPGMIAFAVATGVSIGSQVGAKYHQRYRTNTFLDKANDEIFHRKNMHAMIMTWRPGSDSTRIDVDADTGSSTDKGRGRLSSLGRVVGSRMSGGENNSQSKFRTSDGTTHGELSLPAAAELIFPDPWLMDTMGSTDNSKDHIAALQSSSTPQKAPNAWKITGKSIADYMDRRAQAKFAMLHGADSGLAIPGAMSSSKFVSKYADPNYTNPLSGGLAALRGGDTSRCRDRSRNRSLDEKWDERRDRKGNRSQSLDNDNPHDDHRSRRGDITTNSDQEPQQEHLKRGLRGMMAQKDVLYLMIAEIPSQEEMSVLMDLASKEEAGQANDHEACSKSVYG